MDNRRAFLQASTAAFTTSLFTGRLKGANDRPRAGFIGMGRMGMSNLGFGIRSNVEIAAVCDVYQPHLEQAGAYVRKNGQSAREIKDFREIIADKSIDIVCVSTPDHWHAHMTVEACKAGKDVYVEKPVCTFVEEGQKMVQAARKYNRVVQAGTMQRSGVHFQQACEIVRSGQLGKITFCRTWNTGNSKPDGYGNPPDEDQPPLGLDWNMWLGPAPMRRFNANRWGVHPEMARKPFPYFRYFWDYAGGSLTDWGVHVLDIVHMAMDEPMPRSVTALGGKYWITDNRETPDTLLVTFEYPQGFLATYENRLANGEMPLGQGYGTMFHGTRGTLYVNRSFYRVIPERGSGLEAVEVKSSNNSNMAHWANFLECVKTRQRPISDIETCYKTSAACILGNVSLLSKLRLDWDEQNQTVVQREARKYLMREYRAPWKLEV